MREDQGKKGNSTGRDMEILSRALNWELDIEGYEFGSLKYNVM